MNYCNKSEQIFKCATISQNITIPYFKINNFSLRSFLLSNINYLIVTMQSSINYRSHTCAYNRRVIKLFFFYSYKVTFNKLNSLPFH